jgi:uncharacterized membrane protein
MINRAELKQLAKSQLSGKWGSGVLITFVYILLMIGIELVGLIPVLGGIVVLLVSLPLEVGLVIAYINFVKGSNELEVGDLFKGFNNYGKSLGIMLWTALWIILWMLLFIIPGIIKALAYSQSVYIIANNPNANVLKALKTSMKMTEGYKWQIFVMGLSFLGWALLGVLSLFIGFLWIVPYINTTYANMFFKLKQLSIEKGICTEEEFNGLEAAPPAPPVSPVPSI